MPVFGWFGAIVGQNEPVSERKQKQFQETIINNNESVSKHFINLLPSVTVRKSMRKRLLSKGFATAIAAFLSR